MKITLTVNGERRVTEAWGGESLLYVLRERLDLPGSKNACEQGECGSCSVLLDGTLVCSCLVLGAQADGHEVTTVEGLADGDRLHRVQEAYVQAGAVQCGFCTPGLVVATVDLLESNPSLARSIEHRFPYLDPLNHLQVELMRRYRQRKEGDPENARVQTGIHISINGVAAGLRNTG